MDDKEASLSAHSQPRRNQPKMKLSSSLLPRLAMLVLLCFSSSLAGNVTYDHRSLIISGQRKLLISASIHYPRSVPAMWPGLVQTAKEGGVDVIDTYVFWNGHELSPGNVSKITNE